MKAAREHSLNVTDVAGARPEPAADPLLSASPDTLPRMRRSLTKTQMERERGDFYEIAFFVRLRTQLYAERDMLDRRIQRVGIRLSRVGKR
jgi:hypothetical protein